MCDPVSITLGVLSAGLGIGQSIAGAQAAQDQVNYANAQAQQNFAFQQMQASSARNFEQLKQNQQEEVMRINRMLADNSYADEISQLNLRLQQEQAASSQEQQKGAIAGLKSRGEIVASGRLGNTVDNLVADVYRQQAQFDFATSQNLAFTGDQIQQQKRGVAAQRGSRIASQQAYIKQPVLDPMEPIYQQQPSMLPFILQGAGAVVSGVSTGISSSAALGKIKAAQPPKIGPVAKAAGVVPRAGYYGPAY
jgi:hypothetical protein